VAPLRCSLDFIPPTIKRVSYAAMSPHCHVHTYVARRYEASTRDRLAIASTKSWETVKSHGADFVGMRCYLFLTCFVVLLVLHEFKCKAKKGNYSYKPFSINDETVDDAPCFNAIHAPWKRRYKSVERLPYIHISTFSINEETIHDVSSPNAFHIP
jgi:hypothetical protein